MGKVAAATETKRKKKKGRPSLLDLQRRALEQEQLQQTRRSTRRNPNSDPNSAGINSIDDEEYYDDDDDERKEKKVKLVVRLPQSTNQQHFQNDAAAPLPRSSSLNSASYGSDSNADGENPDKKPKINVGSGDSLSDQREKVLKATDTLNGSPLESGPTTPLPDKKFLVFILDRLQKKDTYGVFSEPVDANELPDYHEIIEHPMDFGTVRSKLDQGQYSNLEELEGDVFLICSNAMQYNSTDTIYFRQARSIQELAKRDFENLRQEGDDGELQPKVVRRGRPPSKHLKKPVGRPPLDRVAPEVTSGATLATAEDNTNDSNPYNLRRAPMLYKFQPADGLLMSQRVRNGENYSEWSSYWYNEFPASILRADMKYGKKHFSIDETRRDTYKQFHPSAFVQEPSLLSNFGGDMKQLMPVGLQVEYGYARSLARFAANLGPVVWKVASKKIERALPPGVKFGPGRVGENETSPPPSFLSPESQKHLHRLASDGFPSRPVTPPTSGMSSVISSRPSLPIREDMVEPDRKVNSPSGISGIRPGPSLQTQHSKPLTHHGRNGFNGRFGYNPSQMGMVGLGSQGSSVSTHMLSMVQASDGASARMASTHPMDSDEQKLAQSSRTPHSGNVVGPAPVTCQDSEKTVAEVGQSGKPSWQVSSTNYRQLSLPVPPDLNVGIQGSGSPSSGLRIGSPQQPDLALQL